MFPQESMLEPANMDTQASLNLNVTGTIPEGCLPIEHWLEDYRKTSNWARWNHVAEVETIDEVNHVLSKWSKIEQIQFNNGLAMLLDCERGSHRSCDAKLLAIVRDTGYSDMYLTTPSHGLRHRHKSTEVTEQMTPESEGESQMVLWTPKNSADTEIIDSHSPMDHMVEGRPSATKLQLDTSSSDEESAAMEVEQIDQIPVVPKGHQEVKYKITTDVADLQIEAIYGTIYHFDCHLWVVLFCGKNMPALVPASAMNRYFPEKVIRFYERRIEWADVARSNFKVRLSEGNPALSIAKFDCSCDTKPY